MGRKRQTRECLQQALAIFGDIKSSYAQQARAQLAAKARANTEPDPESHVS